MRPSLTKIDLTATPRQVQEIRVGNVPHSVVISADGTTAYVSNEAGRIATEEDFQIYSNGTEIVADPVVGAAITGTVSVVDLASLKVTANISTGLHPTGMAFYGDNLLVANTYSDTISVIDTATNEVRRTINLGLPIGVPGARPTGLWRRAELDRRRWQEWHCLRRALQCQRDRGGRPHQSRDESRPGHDPGGLCAELGRVGRGQQRADRCQRQGHRHRVVIRYEVRTYARRATTTPTRTTAPSASFPCQTARPWQTMTQQVFAEQPLGSDAKYRVGLRWQPEYHAGRNPGEDRRSVADQARVPDHP